MMGAYTENLEQLHDLTKLKSLKHLTIDTERLYPYTENPDFVPSTNVELASLLPSTLVSLELIDRWTSHMIRHYKATDGDRVVIRPLKEFAKKCRETHP